ncbi:nucleoid occlusion factor SlmA [Limnohabitans sp. Rim8]|uniref:nucleoid occlusion factor SlmA n=1 Tax=Limnohabitans sp. Rim8 TaxID=1100718 RepID=UPI003305A31A
MSDAANLPFEDPNEPPARKRPRPGERRVQILQTLAAMLEQPGGERVTTAALSARLGVSEAALYRHFASKAQMFEGLIDFMEHSLMALIRQVQEREPVGVTQALRMVTMVLQFAEKNPGMTRVMTGDALLLENGRLQERVNLLFDKVEALLRQTLREGAANTNKPTNPPSVDAQIKASLLMAFTLGRLQQFVRSGFKRSVMTHLDACLALLS